MEIRSRPRTTSSGRKTHGHAVAAAADSLAALLSHQGAKSAITNKKLMGENARPWRIPMVARSSDEHGRALTPLELLFDLTSAVAVAAAITQLAHAITTNHIAEGLPAYLMVFVAIWGAWTNFTWFASAYDCDDTPYRLLTLLQIGGVLIVAAGVPAAFNEQNSITVAIGYVIMRVAMLGQWARAAYSDPERRATTLRYVIGTAPVQAGWLLRLALPARAGFVGFFVLVLAELAIPIWAESHKGTTWHPRHIAKRYGLFTTIMLGECLLASSRAFEPAVHSIGLNINTVLVGAGGPLLLFAAWWLYFLTPATAGLARRRNLSFWWGCSHYGIFTSLAALGSGLEVAAEMFTHSIKPSTTLVAFTIAIPIICFMVLMGALRASLDATPYRTLIPIVIASAATAAIAAGTRFGLALTWAVAAMSVPLATIVAVRVVADHCQAGGARNDTQRLASEILTYLD